MADLKAIMDWCLLVPRCSPPLCSPTPFDYLLTGRGIALQRHPLAWKRVGGAPKLCPPRP